MKRLLTLTAVFLGLTSAAFGQEYRKTFSLELGVSQGPLHIQSKYITPSYEVKKELAELGQRAVTNDGIYPTLTLSGVFRTGYRWETVATGSVSWCYARIIQYESFGVDPHGKPRYDLTQGKEVGWKKISPSASLTVQARVFWNPQWRVQMYSGFGLGFSTVTDTIPLLSLTPVGCRLGLGHIYCFAETGFTPFASYAHGGLGLKF